MTYSARAKGQDFIYGTTYHAPDVMLKGGATYRVVTDHLGSVRLVVDVATGAVAQRLDYDEWGRVLLDTNPGFQPFGYAGGLYDSATGPCAFWGAGLRCRGRALDGEGPDSVCRGR